MSRSKFHWTLWPMGKTTKWQRPLRSPTDYDSYGGREGGSFPDASGFIIRTPATSHNGPHCPPPYARQRHGPDGREPTSVTAGSVISLSNVTSTTSLGVLLKSAASKKVSGP